MTPERQVRTRDTELRFEVRADDNPLCLWAGRADPGDLFPPLCDGRGRVGGKIL